MKQVVDRKMSIREMGDMVNPDLLNHIGLAFEDYAKKNSVTVSCGEMTLAAGLAMEVGNSCDNEDEIHINIEAYYKFILHYALQIFRARMSTH